MRERNVMTAASGSRGQTLTLCLRREGHGEFG